MYNERTWLNVHNSELTESIVAFEGSTTDNGKSTIKRFLEVADNKNKIRLRQDYGDSREHFIAKMKLLKNELKIFIDHMERTVS